MVKNLHEASERLPDTMRGLDSLLQDLDLTSTEVRKLVIAPAARHRRARARRCSRLTERLNSTADNLEKTSAGINRFVEDNRGAVTGFAQDGLPQLQRMVEEAHDAAAEFRELARSLKENPSQLIYQPAQRGVEVPR